MIGSTRSSSRSSHLARGPLQPLVGYNCELEIKHYYRILPSKFGSKNAHCNSYSLLVPLPVGMTQFVRFGLFDDFLVYACIKVFIRIHLSSSITKIAARNVDHLIQTNRETVTEKCRLSSKRGQTHRNLVKHIFPSTVPCSRPSPDYQTNIS